MSGHEEAGRDARINLDLALAVTLKSGELRASVSQADLNSLEDTVAHLGGARNFIFWCLGAFTCLLQSTQAPLESQAMADQHFKSMQKAFMDHAQDSAAMLGHLKALRRESYLRHLPSSFSTSTKMDPGSPPQTPASF